MALKALEVLQAPDEPQGWWVTVFDDAFYRAWASTPRRSDSDPVVQSRLLTQSGPLELQAWVAGTDSPYTGRLIMAFRGRHRGLLTQGVTVQMVDRNQPADRRRWEDVGALLEPAEGSVWMDRAPAIFKNEVAPLVLDALHPWPVEVRLCRLSSDGNALLLEAHLGWGEVLAEVRLTETLNDVTVLLRAGIDPSLPRPTSGPGRHGRPALERKWRTKAALAAPLGDRLVYDLADPDSRLQAEHSWNQWRQSRR